MAIPIPANHALFSTENEIKDICHFYLPKLGISYFNYGRMYDDGGCCLLSNNNRVNQYLFHTESPVFTPIPASLLNHKFFYLLPVNAGSYQKVMHDVKAYFNLSHALDFFECYAGYIDVYCFSSSNDNEQIVNVYLNGGCQLLAQFIADFKEQAKVLIEKVDKQRMYLPQHMQLNFNSTMVLPELNQNDKAVSSLNKKGHYLSGDYAHVCLTKREVDCLSKLVMGYTAKETARSLNLSPRTIETYLLNIKAKLGCCRRSEIIAIVLKHGLKEWLS